MREILLEDTLLAQSGQDVIKYVEGGVLGGPILSAMDRGGGGGRGSGETDPGVFQKEDVDLGARDLAHFGVGQLHDLGEAARVVIERGPGIAEGL